MVIRPNPRPMLDAENSQEPAESLAVRRFLLAQGVREHNHASEIARIIDVDRSQSYRRLKGDVAWSQTDLRAVARHYGAAEDHLIAAAEPPPGGPRPASVPALLRILRLPPHGHLVPGVELDPQEHSDLVAVRSGAGWEVYLDGDEPPGAVRHAVEALTLHSPPLLRVALLEDDTTAAGALIDAFRPLGILAEPFTNRNGLQQALGARRFDAFVLDWLLGDGTAAPVVEAIRLLRAHVPIVVVTGALADVETERLLYELSAKWNFSTLDKPVRPMNLANAIKQLVAAGRD